MRIAIVNDLALARAVLRKVIESVPGYSLAWEAVNGADAVTKAAADRPDVILMDLMMPVLDGAGATRRIMKESPCPVLVVTSSVGAHHAKVYEALGAGGLDAVRTPTLGPGNRVVGADPLLARLAKLAVNVGQGTTTLPALPSSALIRIAPSKSGPTILAIGASTGGPEALATVLSALGPSPVPVILVQHIGSDYIRGLADWLKHRCGRPVIIPEPRTAPNPGTIYLAGGDEHLTVDANGTFVYDREPEHYSYRPSVDVLFASLAKHWPGNGIAVLLTGMGSDGARGLLKLKSRGWTTIAQDEATCVVYGMPKAAAELNASTEVLPLTRIGSRCRELLANGQPRPAG